MSEPRLYVRQVQVFGEAAQRALVTARLRPPDDATTGDYLQRAGVVFVEGGSNVRDAGVAVSELVSSAHLEDAARALLGAFAAVEAIKAVTGVGTPASWPRGLRLDDEKT